MYTKIELIKLVSDRLTAQELKGKAADKEALALLCGAAMLASLQDDKQTQDQITLLAFLVSCRGYKMLFSTGALESKVA